MLTPQEIAQKQIQNSKNSTANYVKGVQSSTKNPMQLAIAQQEKMLRNTTDAITSGKWASNLGAVSVESYKNAVATKGARNYAQGVQDAAADIVAFHAEFQPFVQAAADQVRQMPSMTLEDNIQRAAEMIRKTSQFKRSPRRR